MAWNTREIPAMGDAGHRPEGTLRTLDAELAATIERLQRARAELGLILHRAARQDMAERPAQLDVVGRIHTLLDPPPRGPHI